MERPESARFLGSIRVQSLIPLPFFCPMGAVGSRPRCCRVSITCVTALGHPVAHAMAHASVPFQPLLGTVVGGTPLHHKASGRLRLGRRPILFGTVAYRWRLPAGGLRSVSVAMHTVVHQSKGTEPIDKQRSWTICKQCGLRGLFAGCLQTMWSHLRLLWVRRPACLQRMWADEYLCLWVSLRMIVGR
jgi:hypothetical protein